MAKHSPSAALWRASRNKRRSMKKALIVRHEGRCAHCGTVCTAATSHAPRPQDATVDHVTPRCDLPLTEWFNPDHAVLSCFACNQAREREMTRQKVLSKRRVKSGEPA